MATITASNSIFMLAITGLFNVPQRLQGYMAEDAFSTEAVTPAELVMGVDGKMSAGFVPVMTPMTISIMPDSPSSLMFDAWIQAQKAAGEVYQANGIISIPGINTSYVLTNGVLSSYQSIPGVRKVLQGRPFTITWESIDAVPI